MIRLTDQSGRELTCSSTPKRIVSLVPSISETIAECLGMGALVGVTKFCVHPTPLRKQATVVGGTKNPNIALIRSLNPDIVLANKEENREEDIRQIQKFCPVYVSEIRDISDVLAWLEHMEVLFSAPGFGQLHTQLMPWMENKRQANVRAAYLIWQKPYMTVGVDTFINAMMAHFGLENVFRDEVRYPLTDLDAIRERKPDLILLSSEPYPFRQKHADEMQTFFPGSTIRLADGELFSWYGSRMLQANKEISAWLEQLFDAPANSIEGDEAEILSILIEQYEDENYPIAEPDPTEEV